MNLRDWLKDNGMTQTVLAGLTGINQSRMSYIITGTAKASDKQAQKIEEVTDGDVTAESILDKTATSVRKYRTPEEARIASTQRKRKQRLKEKEDNSFSLL